MKKLVLTSICVLAMAGVTFAQGLINWNTAPGGNFIVQTNATAYSPLFGGGSASGTQGSTSQASGLYYYTLLYGSQNTTGTQVANPSTVSSLIGGWNTTGLTATNGATANGRIAYVNPQSSATLPWGGNTDVGGQSNNIAIVGWSASLGLLGNGLETWQNVSNVLANWNTGGLFTPVNGQNYFFGMSATGFFVGNDSPSAGASWNAAAANTFTANGLLLSQASGNAMQLFLLPVPEPATIALAGLSGLSLLLFRRRKV